METLVAILCVVFFALLVAVPSLYGFHMYLLLYLAHRRRASVRAEQQACIAHYQQSVPDEQWPLVTTQIPLYNEINVARRIIEAAARMDYPHGRHEVQVLDDSTDGTRQVVDHVVAELQSHGYHVVVVRRPQRTDYKAGALAHGLLTARGEFVAVFDADFVPDRGFLRRMVPLLASDPRACAVQGRWGHLNAQETWITSGLALSLDNLFAIEQGARGWNGLLMGFNGTGGMWRRAAVDDPAVGGWSGDTITEDLDLSYRAQLAGWRMIYCADEVSPAELPADADAVKSQQRRWAVGTIQTARKLLPAVWRSQLPLAAKVEGTLHLLQYGIYLPMLCVALLGRLLPLLPMMLFDEPWPIWLNSVGLVFLGAALAPVIVHIYARRALGGRTPGFAEIVKLLLLGLGLTVNNAVAVATGLVQRGGEFVRTPKSGSQGHSRPRGRYRGLQSKLWILELLVGTFCFAQWCVFVDFDGPGSIFLLLYATGLLLMGWQSRPRSIRGKPKRIPATAPLQPGGLATG